MNVIRFLLAASFVVGIAGFSCSPADDTGGGSGGSSGSGGSKGSGGSGSGGNGSGSGGSGSGGSASGGSSGSGGAASGGSNGSGGAASGGSNGSGGSASGGSGSGGSASGGSTGSGGSNGSGGSASGGSTGSGGSASGGAGGRGQGARGGSTATGSGGAGGGAAGTGTFTAVAQILGTSCGTGMCHDGTAHVDLRNMTGLYTRIVNGMPNGSMTMTACKSKKLIVANDTANSVISAIVKAAVTGCSTARMPDDCSTTSANPRRCLTTAQIDTIDSWINAGAPM